MTYSEPEKLAIVYRAKTGCRQYTFENADDLHAWGTRWPYKLENVRLQTVINRRVVDDTITPAPALAAAFLDAILRNTK